MAQNIKTIEELQESAWLYLPSNLVDKIQARSIFTKLKETQDEFLSILKIASAAPHAWQNVLKQTRGISANMFLEHLCILANVGGEPLSRIAKDFDVLFPDGVMRYLWDGEIYEYVFQNSVMKWSNKSLCISEELLDSPVELTSQMTDAIMVLLYAGTLEGVGIPEQLQRCNIGNLIGKPQELEAFVRQRYISISPILKGRDANNTGYICEESVFERLKKLLPKGFSLKNKGTIPGVRNNGRETKFDCVIQRQRDGVCLGIEVMFQVTTNSVIERKGNEAERLHQECRHQGHYCAYIIDGSGCFQRQSALKKLIKYSDCCVNMSDTGLEQLIEFIKTVQDD